MTTKELQLFNELQQAIRGLQENNNRLSSALVERIEKVETCLSKKNDPIYRYRRLERTNKYKNATFVAWMQEIDLSA